MKILAIDPSGSFKYGSGITGYCIIDFETERIEELGNIKAKNFNSKERYFFDHLRLLREKSFNILVIENFILYQQSAKSFYNQELETSELIGLIEGFANIGNKQIVKQTATSAKTILKKQDVLLEIINKNQKQITMKSNKKDNVQWYFQDKRISNHIVDSLRHAFYYITRRKQECSTK